MESLSLQYYSIVHEFAVTCSSCACLIPENLRKVLSRGITLMQGRCSFVELCIVFASVTGFSKFSVQTGFD